MFVDTLNEYYASFYREMEAPYDSWRKYSYDEALALRELKAAARCNGASSASCSSIFATSRPMSRN